MTNLFSDLKTGVRSLGQSPGLTAVAVLTLAIGIGANVAIFSLVDEIWLRPLPVPQPDRLVRIYTSKPTSEGVIDRGPSSYPDFESIRQSARAFSDVAAFEGRGALLDSGHETTLVTAAVVSGNFFDLLAPVAAAGRTFTETETKASGARVVMLSYPFWRKQFGGDPTLPGRTIGLDRQQVLVAGVLPRGFRGTQPFAVPDVWIRFDTWIALTGDRVRLGLRDFRDYDLFARLVPGATLPSADAELAGIATQLEREFPKSNSGRRMSVVAESRSRGASVARLSSTLLVIAGLVLLLACANVASLLLARAESRRFELATRIALGASRLRLVRQLVVETALLAVASTAAALLLGDLVIDLLPRLLPSLGFAAPLDPHMSGRVLLFGLTAATIALAVFGLLPAWLASGTAPIAALKGQRGLSGAPRPRLRAGLVIVQVALSTGLAVVGSLLVRSLVHAYDADPGFDAHQNLLVVELVPGFGSSVQGGDRAFVDEARRRIEALPGVLGTAVAMRIPFGMSGSGATRRAFLAGAAAAGESDGVPIHYDPVSERFFELLGTRLVRGRGIEARDVRDHVRVAVINQAMAARFWPGHDPIGQRFGLDQPDDVPYEVIGVAQNSVNADLNQETQPYLYTPMAEGDYGELTLIVKSAGDAATIADPVRHVFREVNPDVPTTYLATVREHMRLATSDMRMTTGLIVALGALGLLLVALGLHSLIVFLAGRRTREIGIRMALGAAPRAIFDLVIRGALLLSGAGLVAGAAGAAFASRALRSYLYGVTPGDSSSYATAAAVILAVTMLTAYLPARRAARTDPSVALREE
jgi:predicted permease